MISVSDSVSAAMISVSDSVSAAMISVVISPTVATVKGSQQYASEGLRTRGIGKRNKVQTMTSMDN